jgi:hypothetical protein
VAKKNAREVGPVETLIKKHIFIIEDPDAAGAFIVEPVKLKAKKSDGNHRIRLFNAHGFQLTLTFTKGGFSNIDVPAHGHTDLTVNASSQPGTYPYAITFTVAGQKRTGTVIAPSDPEIIVQ